MDSVVSEQGQTLTLSAEVLQRLQHLRTTVQAAVAQVVVGMEPVVDQFLIAMLARGHVLLEGVPGTAKTTLAKTIAAVLGLSYQRVQFTPDLLPADITGTYVFDRQSNQFQLRQGPLFCQLLLADEVNRAPAKTQSALLEAMQETQVTIEGTTLPLPAPFFVLATQNPVEQEGVYRLPEAQLDRFLMRVEIGYPSREVELGILELYSGLSGASQPAQNGEVGGRPATQRLPRWPEAAFNADQILLLQSYLQLVFAEPRLLHYIVDLARASRVHPDMALGASPRATLVLLQCARARALLFGRAYATHEDVQELLSVVLAHRMILKPEAELEGRSAKQILAELIQQVPVLTAKTTKTSKR